MIKSLAKRLQPSSPRYWTPNEFDAMLRTLKSELQWPRLSFRTYRHVSLVPESAPRRTHIQGSLATVRHQTSSALFVSISCTVCSSPIPPINIVQVHQGFGTG
jgi:hypothetical protein